VSRLCDAIGQEIGPVIYSELRELRAREAGRVMSVLDVGCWDGERTAVYRDILGGAARGIEIFPEQVRHARERGVDVAVVDLETGRFPWADASVDVAVANQVFEHLKNVFLPMSEIARVLAPGGYLVFSVPNLASVHNRLMLAAGRQPSSIRTFGPHVRGFTYRQARAFVAFEGFYEIVHTTGVGFHPLPAQMVKPLARAWPAGSHTPVIVARRVAPAGTAPPWRRWETGEQTFYAASATP